MLSNTENLFVRILRGTVIATASFALFVMGCALVYAAYAQLAPEPRPNLSSRTDKFRQATDPAKLIKELFPNDSEIFSSASKSDDVVYAFRQTTTDELFAEFNKFLNVSLKAKFEDPRQFSDWLYGQNAIPFSWSKAIDTEGVTNESSVQLLWQSLFLDYAKRLQARAPMLGNAREQRLYPTAFDRMTSPTGNSRAPMFVVWFFNSLQQELQRADADLTAAKVERGLLRLQTPFALTVAMGAFSYFIFIMFLFLVVSIEASLRRMAEERTSVATSDRSEPEIVAVQP